MRVFCVYTKELKNSLEKANRAVSTGEKYGINVELYESVYYKNIHETCESLNLKLRYTPRYRGEITDFKKRIAPAPRIANGITHYMLYTWSVENDTPITIVEHDSVFVGELPEPIEDGIIQVSSHKRVQLEPRMFSGSVRAQKMKEHEPDRKFEEDWISSGVMKHPLSGMNGTSGYVVGTKSAKIMKEYIEESGVGFADRVREEHIGTGNLYLQIPQSVFCYSDIHSCKMMG